MEWMIAGMTAHALGLATGAMLGSRTRDSSSDSSSDEYLESSVRSRLSTSGDQSAQIEELKRDICSLKKVVEQQKQELDTKEKDYKEKVRKLKDDLSAALARNVLHTKRWKRRKKDYEDIVRKLKDDLTAALTRERTHAKQEDLKKQLKQSEDILGKEIAVLENELEKAKTEVQELKNRKQFSSYPKEKERLEEELQRKKEEVRHLIQYKELMEKRNRVLTATIQMLKQDCPRTDDYNISLYKLIEEEAKLQIESEIMNVQLQKWATVPDAHTESETVLGFESTACGVEGPYKQRSARGAGRRSSLISKFFRS